MLIIKWIIAAVIIFIIYRLFSKQESATVIKRGKKIDYKKVEDAEFEDHE
tara:strand:+ start:207 stop:356 length:150 start_codon:yes stop_codon:yes gene_type:complete